MTPPPTNASSKRNWLALILIRGLLLFVCLAVLPMIARQPRVAERIGRLDARGIDPTAIFYSELDAMPAAEAHIRRVRSAPQDPLW